MSLLENIKLLSKANAVSGFEKGIANYLKNVLEQKLGTAYIDNMGNVIACKKSDTGCGSLMLEAHLDEIGLMVKSIDDMGFLGVVPIGGIDARILPGSCVTVHSNGKNFKGVIGAKPPHVMTSEEYESVIGFDKLFIDCGFETKEQADKNVTIGASVSFDNEFLRLKNNMLSSKAMDDRASVAVLLSLADKLSGKELGYDLYIAICVQEEVGLRGSVTAAYEINPDFAIAIDVTHAKTPDEAKLGISCGSGFAVCKGPNIHPRLSSHFISFLDKNSIKYEIEIEGGNTGTDAWAIQTAREGTPVMLLSLPLKYMHTPIETLALDDCELLSDTLERYLLSFKRTEEVIC